MRMVLLMQVKVDSLSELLPTSLTLKWFLPSMRPAMQFHVILKCKSLITYITLKWFLACMNQCMSFEPWSINTNHWTISAVVQLFNVWFWVINELGLRSVLQIAVLTRIHFNVTGFSISFKLSLFRNWLFQYSWSWGLLNRLNNHILFLKFCDWFFKSGKLIRYLFINLIFFLFWIFDYKLGMLS